jgi:hypothetical protein
MAKKNDRINTTKNSTPPFNECDLVRVCVLLGDYSYYEAHIGMPLTRKDVEDFAGDWRKNDIFCIDLPKDISHTVLTKLQEVPGAEQSRCFIPGYRLEFFANGKPRIHAGVCWKCDRVAFHDPGKHPTNWASRSFDGQSPEAIELLNLIRENVIARI